MPAKLKGDRPTPRSSELLTAAPGTATRPYELVGRCHRPAAVQHPNEIVGTEWRGGSTAM